MRALRPEDPETLGGHRLLARLGAGGMGTVYLARAADGTPVALKVIRAEYAADPAFRARFRREVRLAGGISGRWVVPVTAADAEADSPWLATAFVAGPSLAEAVTALGPLPGATVVGLGARLGQALAEMHTTGLVHRDVKPGNILLALDGPRLIDFGIALGAGGAALTALTAPDAVIGTPGYLSPEQARASAGEVAAPSDVFALGCVLAYAATGRRPFGTGDPSAVLYRTVHEEPDLAALHGVVPAEVAAAVTACLEKEPAARPTASELRATFEAAGPDPDSARVRGSWLPPEVLRLVAERSTRALDPPPRPPYTAPETLSPGINDERPSRRRALVIGGSAVTALAASGGAAAVLLIRRPPPTQGGGSPRLPTRTVGFQADMSGADKDTGTAQERAARLAVADHNARKDIAFRLALVAHDDRGEADRAATIARRLVADPAMCATIGPTSPAAVRAAAPVYGEASMPFLLVSAEPDTIGLSTADARTLCVTRAGNSSRALPLIHYLTHTRPSRRTAVIEDAAAGAASREVARDIREAPPNEDDGGEVTVHALAADQDDPTAAVAEALDAGAEAVVFAGTSPARAAACARALAAAGFTGERAGLEPVMRPAFLDAAGDTAEGWVFEAPYTEAQSTDTKEARAFTSAYRAKYRTAPGRWAAEAYDAVGLLGRALDAFGSRTAVTPAQVAERLFRTSYEGLAKPLSFMDDGTHMIRLEQSGFLYRVESGRFGFLGRFDQVR
ncbi:bifunctional serine/threonine-protein kinase/ABC transporter substrate-binding protein [Streptomyces sp. NPDC088387]|uniref:bifunctional serine/threonine-protein kinase/ABC transporter substrate-binding protein n=1 Tax=Streptomyces sp. NPDC088387 TaxID=3365859 RepID=UPI0038142A67